MPSGSAYQSLIIPPPKAKPPPAAQGGHGPPIIVPHSPTTTYHPGAIQSHFSPGPAPSRRYLPPAAGHAQVYTPPSGSSHASVVQAARERQRLQQGVAEAMQLLMHHHLSEGIQHEGFGLHPADIGYLVPGYGELKAFSHIPGIAGNAAKDLVNLPSNTLQGAEGLISAIGHNASDKNINQDVGLGKIVSDAWKQSVTGHLLNGDLSGALKSLGQHPIYGGTELLGDVGAVGRLAGAAGRSGLLGRRIAEAASTARDARPIAQVDGANVLPPISRSYSKNLFTKGFQKVADRRGVARAGAVKRELNKRVDTFKATTDARSQEHISQLVQQLKDNMPTRDLGPQLKGKGVKRKIAAADVVPFAHMSVAGPEADFVNGMHDVLANLRAAEPTLTGKHLTANLENQKNVEAFLADPNTPAVVHAAAVTRDLHNQLDDQLAAHGLLHPEEGLKGALKPVVDSGVIPDVYSTDQKLPTQMNLDAKSRARELADMKKELNATTAAHPARLAKAKLDAKTEIANARVKLERAKQAENDARRTIGKPALGHVEGQLNSGGFRLQPATHGLDTSEAAANVSDAQWLRLQERMSATDRAAQDLKTAQIAGAHHIRDTKAFGLDSIAAGKANLKDAVTDFNQTYPRAVRNSKVSGIVHDLGNGAFRNPATDELHAALDQLGIPRPAYMNKTLPDEGAVSRAGRKFNLSRGGGTRAKSTGAGVKAGLFVPGYKGVARSLTSRLATLERAKSSDLFFKEFAAKGPDGASRVFNLDKPGGKAELDNFLADIQHQTGQDWVAMPAHAKSLDEYKAARVKTNAGIEAQEARSNIVVVPKQVVNRYLKHMAVDESRGGIPTMINRQFRNTVLPFSPKWVAGNMVEAGLRGGLSGAGPKSLRLEHQVLERMKELHPDEAAHLERLATGGLHYGMNERANRDAIGMNDIGAQHQTAAEIRQLPVIKQVGDAYAGTVQGIFHLNRMAESMAERAVLGRHMQTKLQEFAGSWLKATHAQRHYIDQLAHHYADPQAAAEAGRYVHEVLGQYDQFSPTMRRLVQTVAPFSPWYRNAIRFVYHTLPFKHPVAQAVLTDVARTQHQNQGVPHDTFFGLPVGSLLSDLPAGTGAYQDLGRYTPFGALTGGPLDWATQQAGPQVAGAIRALLGQDPFGQDLRGPDGKKVTDTGDRLAQAVSELFGGFSGPTNQLHRIVAEHGSTPYNTEKIWDWNPKLKPNTNHGSGLNRVLNPLFPTYLKKNSTGSGGGPGISGHTPGVTGGGAGGVHGHVPGTVGSSGSKLELNPAHYLALHDPEGGFFSARAPHQYDSLPRRLPFGDRLGRSRPHALSNWNPREHAGGLSLANPERVPTRRGRKHLVV